MTIDIQLELDYEESEGISRLFSECTAMLVRSEPMMAKCLKMHGCEDEAARSLEKYWRQQDRLVMLLNTKPFMVSAVGLFRYPGFKETASHCPSPFEQSILRRIKLTQLRRHRLQVTFCLCLTAISIPQKGNDIMRTFWTTTSRLGFSVWTEGDTNLARLLWGDPLVTRYLCASGTFTPADIIDRLALEIDHQSRLGFQYWPLFSLNNGDLVGCCGVKPGNEGPKILEMGFHLRPSYWGRGLATEAGRRVIEHAFTELGAAELRAGHHPRNENSKRALEKLGFQYLRDSFYAPTGLMHPLYGMKHQVSY